MASSLQQRIATLVDLVAQLTELDQLRERVRKATPSRRSRQRCEYASKRTADSLRTDDHQSHHA